MVKRSKNKNFEWDPAKEKLNVQSHGINFEHALKAFADINRLIVHDEKHSKKEERYFCIGLVELEVITVRFTYRKNKIRIIGAGIWRKGKKIYEQENKKK